MTQKNEITKKLILTTLTVGVVIATVFFLVKTFVF